MGQRPVLLCAVGARRCALPLDVVRETMRPLPIDPVEGAPDAVLGVAVIRGVATPVLALSALLGATGGAPGRFVTIRIAERTVALAVDDVIGVQGLEREALHALPPLLGDARTSVIEAIGAADAQLMVILRTARILPALEVG